MAMSTSTFVATSYGMGRAVETFRIAAVSYDEAIRIADKTMKGHHALPGSHKNAGGKARVIGIKRA